MSLIFVHSVAYAFEDIKERDEKNSILSKEKTISFGPVEDFFQTHEMGFLADSEFLLHFRSYLFDHNFDGDIFSNQPNNVYSVATGGWLNFKSGYYNDWLGIGLTQYASYRLDGNTYGGASGLLQLDQGSINVLGEAYIDLKFDSIHLRLFRQKINTPFMNAKDSRMVPQTFEAVQLISDTNDGDNSAEHPATYILAYVDKKKARNSNSFEDINGDVNSEAVWLGGIRYYFSPLLRAGVISYHAEDYVDIHYTEIDGEVRLFETTKLQYYVQYMLQDSTGKEQGGDIDTSAWGLRLIYNVAGWQFFFNHTDVDDKYRIITPWSSYAGYNSSQISDFKRAGETANGFGVGFNYSLIGLKGFTATIKYIDGNTPDSGRNASSDQTEIDYDLQYVFQSGAIEGVSVRLRYADVNGKSYTSDTFDYFKGNDMDRFRVTINYEARF